MYIESNYFFEQLMYAVENDKEDIIKLLEKVLNVKKIQKLKYSGIESFLGITEYEFSILKLVLEYENSNIEEVYLRIVKPGKIKESIFCYWSLLYEKYVKNEDDKTPKKATITQKTIGTNCDNIILTLSSNINDCVEVHLIKAKNFTSKNSLLERSILSSESDILFVGRKKC